LNVFSNRTGFHKKLTQSAKNNLDRLAANLKRFQTKSTDKYIIKENNLMKGNNINKRNINVEAGESILLRRISSAHKTFATEKTMWKFANNFYRKVKHFLGGKISKILIGKNH
jgi:hypothetical protein